MYGAFKDVQKVNCKKKSWRKSDCGWLCFWTKITSIGFVTILGQIDPLDTGYMPGLEEEQEAATVSGVAAECHNSEMHSVHSGYTFTHSPSQSVAPTSNSNAVEC